MTIAYYFFAAAAAEYYLSLRKIPCPLVHMKELLSIIIVFALSAKMP